jgi:hypothetical protein
LKLLVVVVGFVVVLLLLRVWMSVGLELVADLAQWLLRRALPALALLLQILPVVHAGLKLSCKRQPSAAAAATP